jgi:hypothetical protein
VKQNGFVLWHVRARTGKADPKTGLRHEAASRLAWMPHAVNASLDEFIAFFANRYGDGDPKAGETTFKEKALQSEVIALRSNMKRKAPAETKRRGKFRS